VLLPHYHLYNEDGVCIFVTLDLDPAWRRRPRPTGYYVSKTRIPGNFLSEGMLVVEPWLITTNPSMLQFVEPDAVVVQVIDSLDGDSARGDYAESVPGVVRPLLQWTTQFSPDGREAAAMVTKK